MKFHSCSNKAQIEAYTDDLIDILTNEPTRVPFLVTTAFADFKLSNPDPTETKLAAKTRYVWSQYDVLYRQILTALMNHFQHKPGLHPITYDFIDLPGSKYTFKLNTYDPVMPHLHSIYLVHHYTLGRFSDLVARNFHPILSSKHLKSVTSIDVRPISIADLEHVINYSSKLLKCHAHLEAKDGMNLWNRYPLTESERKARSMPHTERDECIIPAPRLSSEPKHSSIVWAPLPQEQIQFVRAVGNQSLANSSFSLST